MSRPVEWLVGAKAVLQTAFTKLEDQREGSGEKLLSIIGGHLEYVRQFPDMSPVYVGRIRKKLMDRSFYGIFNVVEPTRIIVVALLDLRQDLRQIRRRLLS